MEGEKSTRKALEGFMQTVQEGEEQRSHSCIHPSVRPSICPSCSPAAVHLPRAELAKHISLLGAHRSATDITMQPPGCSANGQLLLFWGLCRQMSLLCLQPHTSLSPLGSCRGQGSMCNVENSMSSREPLWWQPCQEQTLTS